MKTKRYLAALFAASMLAAGCSSPAGTSAGSDVSKSDSQVQAVQLSADQKQSVFHFSWKLFNNVHQDKENTLVSPMSAFFALGMCANGARGAALDQIEQLIGVDTETMNALSRSAIEEAAKEDGQVKIANLMVTKEDKPLESYASILAADYGAQDFICSDPRTSADEINSWVKEHTNGMIDSMTTPEDLSQLSLMLLNALSFDAKWEVPYEGDAISTFFFTGADGQSEETQCLLSTENQYLEVGDLHGFVRPYEGGKYSFAVLIPQEYDQTLEDAMAGIDAAALEKALQSPEEQEVKAAIPSFTLESAQQLNDALKKEGMVDAFSDQADFSGMFEDKTVMISQIFQKAKITVDAQGTQAAASTKVEIMETSAMVDEDQPVVVTCDRPFVYLVMDTATGTPLFIGTQSSVPVQPEQ